MKNFLLNICSSPPLPHVVLWRHSEREGKKTREVFLFKGAHYFSWNEMLETFHHWGLLSWDLLIFTSQWFSSNSTEVTRSALASCGPHSVQGQVNWLKMSSGTHCNITSTPDHGMDANVNSGQRKCKSVPTFHLRCSVYCWNLMLEAGSGAKSGQQKWLPTGMSDSRKKENCGNIREYIFLSLIFLTPVCNL